MFIQFSFSQHSPVVSQWYLKEHKLIQIITQNPTICLLLLFPNLPSGTLAWPSNFLKDTVWLWTCPSWLICFPLSRMHLHVMDLFQLTFLHVSLRLTTSIWTLKGMKLHGKLIKHRIFQILFCSRSIKILSLLPTFGNIRIVKSNLVSLLPGDMEILLFKDLCWLKIFWKLLHF